MATFLYPISSKLAVHPTPFLISDSPHGPLRGDIYLPQNAMGVPVVVAVHGFKGFKNWGFWPDVGRRFAEASLALVTFNMSGSGVGDDLENFTEVEAFEKNTVSKELADLGRVLDAVSSREISLGGADTRRVGLLGHSRGGGVTILRAGRDPRVLSAVTWASICRFQRYSEAEKNLWRKQGFLEVLNARTKQVFKLRTDLLDDLEQHGNAYEPYVTISSLETPLLLVHGTRDEAVEAEEGQILSRAAAPGTGKLALIQGGTHTFGAAHPYQGSTPELDQALEKTLQWFHETL